MKERCNEMKFTDTKVIRLVVLKAIKEAKISSDSKRYLFEEAKVAKRSQLMNFVTKGVFERAKTKSQLVEIEKRYGKHIKESITSTKGWFTK